MLSGAEVERFFAIWKPLLLFVNRRLKLVPEMLDPQFKGRWFVPNLKTLRDALWADDSLQDEFITENPAKLSDDDLAIVRDWRHRLAETFAILRHLKGHSIFIGEDSTVYDVHGITNPLSEIVLDTPCYVKAVLLPFAGRIIYDSLVEPYNVLIGSGIRTDLERIYADAKERGALVTTLPPPVPDPETMRASNTKVVAAFRTHLFGTGLSERVVGRDTAALEELAQHLLGRSKPLSLRECDAAALREFIAQTTPDKTRLTGVKRFVRFLRDTGRMDFTKATTALKVLAQG
jgi:hypothetical protein